MATSASASAPAGNDALLKGVESDWGGLSASQEELLDRFSILRGGEEEEREVFSTPPLTQGQQSQQDPGEEEEDAITMCSVPFTQPSPSPAPSPASGDHEEEDRLADLKKMKHSPRKPRVCIRKVRGARIRTPTPSPSPNRSSNVDPLYRAVLKIPTSSAPTVSEDLLSLARRQGIF